MFALDRASRGGDDRAQPLVPQRRRGSRVRRRDRLRVPAGHDLPLYAKLSPAVPDVGALASAVAAAGAEASHSSTRSVASRSTTGYSRCWGRRRKATRACAEADRAGRRPCRFKATPLPIVGMGGVSTGLDALELIAAGASAVALGTVLFSNPDAPRQVRAELAEELALRGYSSAAEARGAAHLAATGANV